MVGLILDFSKMFKECLFVAKNRSSAFNTEIIIEIDVSHLGSKQNFLLHA